MPFEIVRNDITNMQVDAIVNAASRLPRVNPGVDSAIHKKAGPELLEARKEIGYIQPGTAAITPAFNLDAKYVIHAATPVWEDGKHHEELRLMNTYRTCLELAKENGCDSIAFPLLASGNHGFPKNRALHAAVSAFSQFLMEYDMQIFLVVFGSESVKLSEKLFHNVQCFIDERYVAAFEEETYGNSNAEVRRNQYRLRRYMELQEERNALPCAASAECIESPCVEDLDSFLKKKDAGFVETLLDLIQKSGQKNSSVYKRANMSKQHFSKLINNPNSVPTKATAISLALALRLNLSQTQDLIGRAGYALTNSSVFDLIIQYHIQHKIYNVIEINIVLYDFDQSLLGS